MTKITVVLFSLSLAACAAAPEARRDYRAVGHAMALPGEDPLFTRTPCSVGTFAMCTVRCDEGEGACCNNVGVALEIGKNVAADREGAIAFYDRACTLAEATGCKNKARLEGAPPQR